MRILALTIAISTAASLLEAQPTYYARSVAGFASSGDGGPARAARVFQPTRVTTDAAGNVYIAEAIGRIRKVAQDGTITSFAPRIDGIASGDNGPASEAGISSLFDIAVAGDYLYLTQRAPCNIRRIHLITGIITNFAGNGTCAAGPDGPAASTSLNFPGALAVDARGRIYFTETAGVRRIDPSTGRIEAFAGDGIPGFAGDGLPATLARFNGPLGLAIDSNGNVYISDTGNCRVRRVSGTGGLVSTIAGSPTCGTSGDGGTAILAQISDNGSLALDATENLLYIASNGQTIRRVTLDTGIIDRFAGTGIQGSIQEDVPSLSADLRVISGVHADSAGNILFADFGANRVGRINVSRFVSTVAGAPTFSGDGGPAQNGFLSMPIEVIPEPGGRLLISESINRVVRRVSSIGILSTLAGSGAPGPASGNGGAALNASVAPGALYRDGSGNVYTTDALSGTVRVIGLNRAISQVGPEFNSTLGGIAVDADERFLYVSLTSQHRIAKIAISTGQTVVVAGSGGLSDTPQAGFSGDGGAPSLARLNSPQRLFLDADGSLYIADSGNHRIRRINPNGDRIDTVAGNGLSDFSGEGNPATQASLPNPTGVAVDAQGNILASNASTIFRVEKTTGRMYRIAGGTTRGNSALGVPALQARFNGIANVSVDTRGVIYFAETSNFRIVALTPSTFAAPVVSAVIAPGAFGAGSTITPGSWLEIYGDKLASITRTWTTNDFNGPTAPTSLGGVTLLIDGLKAYLQLVSPGQINAVVPDGVGMGPVTVEVINAPGTGLPLSSDIVSMNAAPRAPYVLAPPSFSRAGRQYAAAILPGGAFAGPPGLVPGANFRPARAGDRVVLYGIGFGPTNPTIYAGNIAPASYVLLPLPRIRIGGIEAQVEYAGLATGYVGLFQFNFVVPSAPAGDAKFEILLDGEPIAQTVYLRLE